MNRQDLSADLSEYLGRYPEEATTVRRVADLLRDRERAFHRDCFEPGHITASAWIVSRESGGALLTHHRKLERWLQLGGHADGEVDVLAAATREAEEESGLSRFEAFGPKSQSGGIAILDIDIHVIPARGDEPAHEHHDIRYLLQVSDSQPIARQVSESKAVRWFSQREVLERFEEESLLRMARKASEWLGRTS